MTAVAPQSGDRILEVAPLGLRFADVVTRAAVADGIAVTAFQPSLPSVRVAAITNRSGTFMFPTLGRAIPGLAQAFSDSPGWDQLPPARPLVVEVQDTGGRYTSFSFQVALPVRGLATFPCQLAEPIANLGDTLPLFSTPMRPITAGLGVVRADLFDATAGAPAAGAVLEIRFSTGPLWRGIADDQGRVAVPFVFPSPEPASPPPAPPPLDSTWTATVGVRRAAGGLGPAPQDICGTLAQPGGRVWSNATLTTLLTSAEVRFQQELVLRTRNGAGNPLPALHITTP